MFSELNELVAQYGGHPLPELIDVWSVGAHVDHADGKNSRSLRLPDTQALVLYTVDGTDRAVVITREEYHKAIRG